MMKYSIYVLIAVSVLASGHARPPLYKKHLMRPNASEYPHGDDEKFDAIMKDVEFPRIASILDHGSRAIVFHGMFGAGKSSVIERLSQIPDLVISSGQNVGNHAQQQDQKGKKAIGHTTLTKPYLMHVPHRNKFLLIDTPGFGEKNDAIRKDVLDESVKVVKILKDNQIPLAGIYFVIDPTPRDTVVKITSNLELIKLCYGEDAAKKTRIVLNKSDQLARTGKVYIEGALQTTLQKDFKSVFGVNCEKIIFICSDI